jgi:hypothetical protein
MRIIYSDEHLPVLSEHKSSIFLVGPTPRTPLVQGWRSQALDILEHLAYDGLVYHPEPRLNWPDFVQQVEWELAALEAASAIVCWVPRNMVNMPALTTNCEFGMFVKSRRLWYGRTHQIFGLCLYKVYRPTSTNFTQWSADHSFSGED